MHFAARYARLDVLRLLLQQRANAEKKSTQRQQTPLHIACSHGKVEAASILLKFGCNANAVDAEGVSALQAVCMYLHVLCRADAQRARFSASVLP